MFLHLPGTVLTLDVATPVELTFTPLHNHPPLGVEPPTATQQLTAVDGFGSPITQPTVGAQGSSTGVRLAEIRRHL